MNAKRQINQIPRFRGVAFFGLGALLFVGGALAETAQATYQRERAACLNGQSHQDRATCLKEAAAALAESRRGGLTAASGSAAERCNVLDGSERAACVARMSGAGVVKGSVEGGGLYRELTVREVMPAGTPPQQTQQQSREPVLLAPRQ